MKERFYNLWTRIGATISADAAFDYVSASYRQSHRFYHTFDHIKTCLHEFDHVRHLAVHPNAVEFAIWYHDVVYHVTERQNEERSALAAYRTCIEAGLPNSTAREVRHLILATKHDTRVLTQDQMLIVDIDLAILGKPVNEFDAYEHNIRKEYAHLSDEQFRVGRTAVLEGFLGKPFIYHTDYFAQKYQYAAIANLRRSIAGLRL